MGIRYKRRKQGGQSDRMAEKQRRFKDHHELQDTTHKARPDPNPNQKEEIPHQERDHRRKRNLKRNRKRRWKRNKNKILRTK